MFNEISAFFITTISQSKKANKTVKEDTIIKVVISKRKKLEYENALKQAETCSERMHMCEKAIFDPLTSEYGSQFTAEAAHNHLDK